MADPHLLGRAMQTLAFEVARGVPLAAQLTLQHALRGEESSSRAYVASHNRRAALAKRTDALQAFILATTRTDRSISSAKLLSMLKRKEFVREVTETTIEFYEPDGRLKGAPISGLKDRLSRAKNSLE